MTSMFYVFVCVCMCLWCSSCLSVIDPEHLCFLTFVLFILIFTREVGQSGREEETLAI